MEHRLVWSLVQQLVGCLQVLERFLGRQLVALSVALQE